MKRADLDVVDIRILSAVQKHGRLSKSQLAEKVNLSPTPCWVRLDKLIKAGFIKGYRAEIAIGKLADFTAVIMTVSLSHHRKSDFDRFETYVQSCDEVVDCIATGGGTDYVMKIVTQSLSVFQEFAEKLLDAEVGVERYMTYIVTRQIKSSSPNLDALVKLRS